MGTSLMDIHISFAEVTPSGSVQPKVGVVLPVEHAAQVALNLIDQINLYERTFGPLRHPQWREFQENTASAETQTKAEPPSQETPLTEG